MAGLKAVIPVAGLGTRFLPATKSVPKEMLTLIDRPLIQYAVDEARRAGIEDFIFVTARGKSSVEDYFDAKPELEHHLFQHGKDELLKKLEATNLSTIAYVRQSQPKGLGHAIWCARKLINDRFIVLLPDVVLGEDCLPQMIEAAGPYASVTAFAPVADPSAYGVAKLGENHSYGFHVLEDMVEKPKDKPPSNLAAIGRYVFTPEIFEHLEKQKPGAGGEIQLTDAIMKCSGPKDWMLKNAAFKFQGDVYDCGSISGLLEATIRLSARRPDLKDDLEKYIAEAGL